ncbi:hypothetical protein RFI_06881, partial [Reticulomyxa filosa]
MCENEVKIQEFELAKFEERKIRDEDLEGMSSGSVSDVCGNDDVRISRQTPGGLNNIVSKSANHSKEKDRRNSKKRTKKSETKSSKKSKYCIFKKGDIPKSKKHPKFKNKKKLFESVFFFLKPRASEKKSEKARKKKKEGKHSKKMYPKNGTRKFGRHRDERSSSDELNEGSDSEWRDNMNRENVCEWNSNLKSVPEELSNPMALPLSRLDMPNIPVLMNNGGPLSIHPAFDGQLDGMISPAMAFVADHPCNSIDNMRLAPSVNLDMKTGANMDMSCGPCESFLKCNGLSFVPLNEREHNIMGSPPLPIAHRDYGHDELDMVGMDFHKNIMCCIPGLYFFIIIIIIIVTHNSCDAKVSFVYLFIIFVVVVVVVVVLPLTKTRSTNTLMSPTTVMVTIASIAIWTTTRTLADNAETVTSMTHFSLRVIQTAKKKKNVEARH